MPKADAVLFCVLAGLLATFTTGYHFGNNNQIDHLPITLRVLDADYLVNDSFINANQEVGPRYYYARLLAALSSIMPLHYVFLVLTVAAKSMLALVTYYVAGCLHRGSALASVLAVALVLCIDSFTLGGAAQLAEPQLQPAMLVRALALLSLWMALSNRVFVATVLAMIAIPIHPLVGLETAGIGLLAHTAYLLLPLPSHSEGFRARLPGLIATAVCGVTLLVFVFWVFGGVLEQSLSTTEFVTIVCESRSPHHYLPSTFSKRNYFLTACFLAATAFAWKLWKRDADDQPLATKILFTNLVVIALLVVGYVFVEIFPVRVVVTAQTFRMLYITKWFGFLLFAGAAAKAITRERDTLPGWCILLASGPYQPLSALIAILVEGIHDRFRAASGSLWFHLLAGVALLQIGAFGANGRWEELQGMSVLVALGAWYVFVPNPQLRRWASVLPVGAVVGLLVMGISIPRISDPQITLDQLNDPVRHVAKFARENTPPDDLFIVPPRVGNFRVLAKRALLVQHKSVPFSDSSLAEWYQRIRDCYLQDPNGEVPLLMDLDEAFHSISDEQLTRVGQKYGVNYAVLYADTDTMLNVVYADAKYQLVQLSPPQQR